MPKPALLFLHGAMGSSEMFKPFIRDLKDDYHIHLLDFEGHGRKSLMPVRLSIEGMSEQVEDFLWKNSLEEVYIFGYSMGGYVALYLAGQRNQGIRKILTLATKFDWNPESADREAAMLNPEKIEQKVPKWAKVLRSLHGDNWKPLCELTADMLLKLGQHPLVNAEYLQNIDVPVRVVRGDRDSMVGMEETIEAFDALPSSELEILPATPHPFEKVTARHIRHLVYDFFSGE